MYPVITKVLWAVIGLNAAVLLVLAVAFLLSTVDRNVTSMESGWMAVLFIAAAAVIAFAALPLYFGKSAFSVGVSGFFAFLPLVILACLYGSDFLARFRHKRTEAEYYYQDQSQRAVAEAIKLGDLAAVKQRMRGHDLHKPGAPVPGGDSLTYLQFAIRLRSNPAPDFQPEPNAAIIRLLIAEGSDPTRALPEGIRYLPMELITELLDAGADPNTHGFIHNDPLLFEAMGPGKAENDIAMLLIDRGAKVNTVNADGNTPLMFSANNAGTSQHWADSWRLARYMIEHAQADYAYTRADGVSLSTIMHRIREKANEENVTMPADFQAVMNILDK